MKKKLFILSALVFISFTACTDWLTEPQPGQQGLEDFFVNEAAAIQAANGVYVPMTWQFGTTYFPEWFIGDIMSDDAIKGGQTIVDDMMDVYEMKNWRAASGNRVLHYMYRANFIGIARANLALAYIPYMSSEMIDSDLQQRLIGEIRFLRAFYYFRLVRIFGGVPLVDFVVLSDDDWSLPRASADEILDFIVDELEAAESLLWHRSEMDIEDLGRITRGAAQAMLARVHLWRAGSFTNRGLPAQQSWEQARHWSGQVIASNEYDLHTNFAYNWDLEHENGIESVFCIQFTEEPTSDFGGHAGGLGFTRGNFTMILTRSRSGQLSGGWGFNKPSWNLFNQFEQDDPRRDITILDTTPWVESIPDEIHFGNAFVSRKYALYGPDLNYPDIGYFELAHPSRGPLNNRQIRFSDVLLMYAEANMELGNDAPAIAALNRVRQRVDMPTFGNYSISINGGAPFSPDLRTAIRHERRMELAMEGHRWFDLVRWGIAKQTMDAYAATLSAEERNHKGTFIEGVHELLPIPSQEMRLNPALTQNPGFF